MSVKAYGTTLEYGDTADYATATTWTPVAKVKNVKPNKVTAKDIDITELNSPDEFEETIAGLASGGELSATARYDKTLTGTIYGFFRTTKAWRLKYPDGSGWKMNAYINEIGDEEVVNGQIVENAFKFKVTGKPVQAAALS